MTHYKDLTETEKYLFDSVEDIFVKHSSITLKEFVRVIFTIGNKYRKRL